MIIHGVLVRSYSKSPGSCRPSSRRAEHVHLDLAAPARRRPAVKLLEALVLFLAVVALLFFVVFPWLEPYLPFDRMSAG